MSKKDEIYRKRLEGIRDELDRYLDCIKWLPIPMLDVPKMVISQLSQNLSSQLEQKELAPVVEKAEQAKEKDNAQEPKKTVYSLAVRPSGPEGGGSAGFAMSPQYMRKDSGRPELDKILAEKEETFSRMLLRLIDEKGLRDSEVYRRADIDRRLFSKIRSDEEYVPSKKTAISFCLALHMKPEEAKQLLATAGYTLSASSRSDLIITYMMEHNEYNIHFVNIVLDDYGEGTLSR